MQAGKQTKTDRQNDREQQKQRLEYKHLITSLHAGIDNLASLLQQEHKKRRIFVPGSKKSQAEVKQFRRKKSNIMGDKIDGQRRNYLRCVRKISRESRMTESTIL